MKYPHVIAEFCRKPWAILPDKLHAIAELLAVNAGGGKFTEEEVKERIGACGDDEHERLAERPALTFLAASKLAGQPGTVALIPIYGVISHRAGMMSQISGGTAIDKLTASFRQALREPSVKAIVFDVDSPGGSVDGVEELATEIAGARGQKKTIAVANTMAASAAYWLASAADQFAVTPSGSVGSIGVFAAHEDLSKALETEGVKVSMISAGKYKTEGNPYEPLSDEAKASMQAMVDDYYGRFVKAVAANRGVSQAKVLGGFGQGRMALSSDALKEGMVDQVATLDQVLAKLGVGQNTGTSTRVARKLQERTLSLYK